MSRLRSAAALALALGVCTGCAARAGLRSRPRLVTPPTFRDAPEQQESIADLPWWEVFKDETLHGLVRESLEQNRDLATAIANVERARDIAAVQRGELFPQVGYTGIASRGKQASLGALDTERRPRPRASTPAS